MSGVKKLDFIFDDAIDELFNRSGIFKDINSFSEWFRKKFMEYSSSDIELILFENNSKFNLIKDERYISVNILENETIYENTEYLNQFLISEIKKNFPDKNGIFSIFNNNKISGFLLLSDIFEENGSFYLKINFFTKQIGYFLQKNNNIVPNSYIQELESKVKTLTKINDFSILLNSIYTRENDTLEKIVEFCGEAFDATHCALILNFEEKQEFEIVAGWQKNNYSPSWIGLKYATDSPLGIIMNEAVHNKKVVPLCDIMIYDNMSSSLGEFSQIFDLKTTIIIPLFKPDNYFGFIAFRKPYANDSDYLLKLEEFIKTISDMLSRVLLNVKLNKTITEIKYYLSNLIKSSRDAIISVDLSGKIILWNQGAENIFGYKEDEIVGKNFYFLFSSEGRSKVTGEWIEILTGRVIMNEEGIGLKKDGKKISVSYTLSPINDKFNNIIGISIIFRDLTEKKKLEKGISESKNRLQAIFDSLFDIIVLFDLNHKILMANKIAINFTGLAPRELIGTDSYPLAENIDINGESPIQITIRTKKTFSMDEIIFDKKVYNIKTFPVFDSIGNLTSVILHARDLTKEKTLYSQLLESERMAMIGELTAIITHELNNPLSIILGYAENIKENILPESENFSHISEIINNINRISNTIDSLSKFSHASSRKGVEIKTITDILPIIKDTVTLLESPYSKRGITFKSIYSNNRLLTWTSQRQLQQLFLSIITNIFNSVSSKKFNTNIEVEICASVVEKDITFFKQPSIQGGNILNSTTLHGLSDSKNILIKITFTGKVINELSLDDAPISRSIALNSSIIQEYSGNLSVEKKNNSQIIYQIFLPYVDN